MALLCTVDYRFGRYRGYDDELTFGANTVSHVQMQGENHVRRFPNRGGLGCPRGRELVMGGLMPRVLPVCLDCGFRGEIRGQTVIVHLAFLHYVW